MPSLVASILQAGLNVEIDEHLGYEPYAVNGRGSGNSRNGSYSTTVVADVGPVEVQMPRDRNASFDLVTVPKYARRLDGLTEQVVSLYAKGMTTGEIQAHLEELCGTELSPETISKITDSIIGDMVAWQNRPLDRVFAVVRASSDEGRLPDRDLTAVEPREHDRAHRRLEADPRRPHRPLW